MDNNEGKTSARSDHTARPRKPGISWLKIAPLAIVTLLYVGPLANTAEASDDWVGPTFHAITPSYMRGVWGQNGDCRHAKFLLIIRKTSASLLGDRFYKTVFIEHDSELGGALHWARQYQTDNFQYDSERDMILWNSEGYHITGAGYDFMRCHRKK